MKALVSKRIARALSACLLASSLVAGSAMAAGAAAPVGDDRQIRHLINTTFDTPQEKVRIAPVVVHRGHAIADWIQGGRGGRALLARRDGRWVLVACGGEAFRQADVLQQAGLPRDTARRLVARLASRERGLPAERIALFDSFGPTVDMAGHGAHGGGHGEPHASAPGAPGAHASHGAHPAGSSTGAGTDARAGAGAGGH